MSYSNQNVKQDPGQFDAYCPGFIDYVNNNYNKKDKNMTKNQFCKQEIKNFCKTDPTISIDNCDDFFDDNQHHQPDSMAAYCSCKQQYKNPEDILNCCLNQTDDQYDCQDDVQNNTPCGDVLDGFQPYCDCRMQIAKNDPDIYKYGNDIISCCVQKSNNPKDCNLYVESKRDCPGIIPDTPPSQPNTPPSQPDTPPSQPDTPPSQPDTPPSQPDKPPSQPDTPSKPTSGKTGSKQNNILESLTVPEIVGFVMAIIVICILIYFIIELSKKK